MAHKASLPHPPLLHHKPARPLSEAGRMWRRRLAIAFGIAGLMVGMMAAAPFLLGTAVAAGLFNGWDSPVDYD